MATVKLGQLFLLRRDLKNEIGNLSSDLMGYLSYREDKESCESDYLSCFSELEAAREKLHIYDRLIECENSKRVTITFKHELFSLNDARHYKVHLVANASSMEHLVRQAAQCSKRTDAETVYEPSDPSNPASTMVAKRVERKFIVVPDLKWCKAQVKSMKQDIQLLDSLIQQLDWSVEVEIP